MQEATTGTSDNTRTVSFSDAPRADTIQGMLQHRIQQILPKMGENPETEAMHICTWSRRVLAGWKAFTQEIILQCGKANPKPLVFAFLTNGEQFIQLAHGFGPMALALC